jgi:hypothetical protein
MQKALYELISCSWQLAVPECKEHVHCSPIKWLHAKGEKEAAKWFEKQWDGSFVGKSWREAMGRKELALQTQPSGAILTLSKLYRARSVPLYI